MTSVGGAESCACAPGTLHEAIVGRDGGGASGQLLNAEERVPLHQSDPKEGASRLLRPVSSVWQLLAAGQASFLHSTGGASALPSAGSSASCLQSVQAAGLN